MPRDPRIPRPEYRPREHRFDHRDYDVKWTSEDDTARMIGDWWYEQEMRINSQRHFVLRTHIENKTPYRKHDLLRLVHCIARFAGEKASKVKHLSVVSGTPCQAHFSDCAAGHAVVWVSATEPNMLSLIDDLRWVFGLHFNNKDEERVDIRQRTEALRRLLKRATQVTLRPQKRR